VAREELGEQISEVGRHREVAALEPLCRIESRPAPEHPAAAHRPAEHQHRRCVPMIRPGVAVFPHRAPELRHGQHHNIAHPLAQITAEGGERLSELREPCRKLPVAPALVDVRVPPGDVRERHLESDAAG